MKERPLLSFAILSYNNYKYIKEALSSVFMQNYPNIQLIISNDGSDDFDESGLISFINVHKNENIKSVYINNNERNIGTVKNVNLVLSKADGEFIMMMAADDALYDENVLTRFVDEFERLGPEAYIISARTAMCGEDLSEVREIFPDNDGIEAIKNFTPQELFSRMTHTFTIPTTSTCYRMSLYDLLGKYDEQYFIIEDAPLFIKMARNGFQFYWIDDMIAARHRHGGISHGNKNKLTEAYRKYRYDEILIYKNEILPYKDQILLHDCEKMIMKSNYLERAYFETFILPNMSKKEKVIYFIKHWPFFLINLLRRLKVKVIELAFNSDYCEKMFKLTLLMLTSYLLIYTGFFAPIISSGIEATLKILFGFATFFFLILYLFQYAMRFIYRYYLAVKHMIGK